MGAIDPLLRPTTTMLSHVQEHLRLKQRGSGPRSGPEMEMESPRVEIPTTKWLFLAAEIEKVADEDFRHKFDTVS